MDVKLLFLALNSFSAYAFLGIDHFYFINFHSDFELIDLGFDQLIKDASDKCTLMSFLPTC